MRTVNDVYARWWRRLHALGKEIASMGVVYTNETGATTEREPAVKPQPRPVTAPPKPPKPPANKEKMRQWTADRVKHTQPRPTNEEALRDF